jgi:hypothetical protein
MTSKEQQMSKHGTTGKRKHTILTVAQKLQIIKRLESCDS